MKGKPCEEHHSEAPRGGSKDEWRAQTVGGFKEQARGV